MKALTSFLLAFFLLTTANAQTWKTVHLDTAVSVSLPSGFTLKENLHQKTYYGETAFGKIFVITVADDPKKTPDIEKKETPGQVLR